MNLRNTVCMALLASSLAACSSDGTSPPDTRAISGLWDFTDVVRKDGVLVEDVVYNFISTDGKLTSFDFLGDEREGGENCYAVTENTMRLISDNEYRVKINAPNEVEVIDERVIAITRTENTLNVSTTDLLDADQDGNTSDISFKVFPLLTGLSIEDFNACDES